MIKCATPRRIRPRRTPLTEVSYDGEELHVSVVPRDHDGSRQSRIVYDDVQDDVLLVADDTEWLDVPCGKCLVCRRSRAHMWATRLADHGACNPESCMITLTYDDDHVPVTDLYGAPRMVLCHRDVQLWLKRLRKMLSDRKLSYYMVGEYGGESRRPHYHMLLYGWWPPVDDVCPCVSPDGERYNQSLILTSLWRNGVVQVGSVDPGSIYYVSGYLAKSDGYMEDPVYRRSGHAPYMRCSNGIGADYMDRYAREIHDGKYVNALGVKSPPPRYYRERVGVNDAVVDSEIVSNFADLKQYYLDEQGLPASSILPRLQRVRDQILSDARAKERIAKARKL